MKIIIFTAFLAAATIASIVSTAAADSITFAIPDRELARVSEYFNRNQFLGPEKDHYQVKLQNRVETATYFDTADLQLLRHGHSLRYSLLEKPGTKKLELIIANLEQPENFTKTTTFRVKHYGRVATFEEKHPLLKLVRRQERATFKKYFRTFAGVDINSLSKIIKVENSSAVKFISQNEQELMTVFLNKATVEKFSRYYVQWNLSLLVKSPLGGELFSSAKKRIMLDVQGLTEYANPYQLSLETAKNKIPLLETFIRYPLLYRLSQAALITMILSVLFLPFWRRLVAD